MKITIIDYGAGNLFSVSSACRKLGYEPVLTSDPELIYKSNKIIFPGVGNASTAMERLKSGGLDEVIPSLKIPVLGICLGMQIMFDFSQENNTDCLGIMKGEVIGFPGNRSGLKVPHMGWNIIDSINGELFRGINEGAFMYFVHSYYVPFDSNTIANSYYGGPFAAAVEKDNFFGCQFHPEKSGDQGIKILKNFLEL